MVERTIRGGAGAVTVKVGDKVDVTVSVGERGSFVRDHVLPLTPTSWTESLICRTNQDAE